MWKAPDQAAAAAATAPDRDVAQPRETAPLPDFVQGAMLLLRPLPALSHAAMTKTGIQGAVVGVSRVGLAAANPLLVRPYFQPQLAPAPAFVRPFMRYGLVAANAPRTMSTTPHLGLWKWSAQHRGFGTLSGIMRNQLATVEESANRNPGNANLQNAFYQLLLRANMPGILVERYQSGRFATNAATEEAYRKALAALNAGTNSTAASAGQAATFARGGGQWSAHDHGFAGPSAGSGNAFAANPMGAKGEPIHVVVQESTRSLIFRWVKFFATFVVVTYLCFAAVTILIETLSTFRRGPGAKNDSEVKAEKQTTRFSDVHGCDEAKEELQEVVEFLRNPEKFSDLGAKLPKGVLLVGPPGTGKTLLARAVAGEAGVPFFYMSGSEFDEIFVGVGAKRVRELFAAAKAKSPSIIFIDELDAIGGKRNPRDQAHAKQTLNQLLTELDGFDQDTKIIIMGATNLPKLLDKALTRPGRFDRHINVDLPDVRGRLAILKHHADKIKCAPDVDLDAVAARSPGRSGAELENMLNLAALRASRARATVVSKHDIDWAFDRITMGAERKSMVITEKEKEMTAYHEAGHALVQLFEKDSSSQLYKVTILPKGPSLGHTAHVPQMDKYSYTAAEYMANIRVLLGGKMAEEMRYGDDKVTSGVSNVSVSRVRATARLLTQATAGPGKGHGPRLHDGDALWHVGRARPRRVRPPVREPQLRDTVRHRGRGAEGDEEVVRGRAQAADGEAQGAGPAGQGARRVRDAGQGRGGDGDSRREAARPERRGQGAAGAAHSRRRAAPARPRRRAAPAAAADAGAARPGRVVGGEQLRGRAVEGASRWRGGASIVKGESLRGRV